MDGPSAADSSPYLGRQVNSYDVMWRPACMAKFDSCKSLLSSVHALLVNILRWVRLYIKRK